MSKISIYQVFTRLFGVKNEHPVYNGSLTQNGSGKMNDFTIKALQEIKKLGITHIWYTGIIQHATCESFPDDGIKNQNPRVVKGKAGSPYAITDYYDVNPYLAVKVKNRMKEFEDLVIRTHKSGMKVIIDFVPNHVARQYASDIYPDRDFGKNDDKAKQFSLQNDFYYAHNALQLQPGMGTQLDDQDIADYTENPAKATGNDLFSEYPTINDWYETVKLNYGVNYLSNREQFFEPRPALWDKMLAILRFWADKKVDAFRCDMAEMVPVEFWNYAIGEMKKEYPHIDFIAEVYNPDLYHAYINYGKFDYLYDKVGLYDTLRNIIQFATPAYAITRCWQSLNDINGKMLRFLENHDEQRIASPQFADNPDYAIPAMIVSATMHNGPVMTYFGQELGEPAIGSSGYSGDDGKTTIFDFYHVPEFQKWYSSGKFVQKNLSAHQKELRNFYKTLLNTCIKETVFGSGQFYDLMWVNNFDGGPDSTKIYAYLRYNARDVFLIVVNFDKFHDQHFNLKIPQHAIDLLPIKDENMVFATDVFAFAASFRFSLNVAAETGVGLGLKAHSGSIFKLST